MGPPPVLSVPLPLPLPTTPCRSVLNASRAKRSILASYSQFGRRRCILLLLHSGTFPDAPAAEAAA